MQPGHAYEDFTTHTRRGVEYRQRIGMIPGLAALTFLVLGGAEILQLLFGHSYAAANASFHLPSAVIAGVSFGLCVLTVKLKSTL
jgi:amino acid transporter